MGERWRWLGRPWFLAAVAALALNDHVLKARVPGWWTGKASDVAGVAVVATLVSVVAGRRAGVALVVVGFVALKVLPGIAEAAVPLLGGQTRRDATDLVGLLVLVPLWSLLREPAGPPHRSDRIAWRNVAAAALPVLGATTAVLATTATSCEAEPAVMRLVADGSTFLASVDDGRVEPRWAASTDGGLHWTAANRPSDLPPAARHVSRWDARPSDLVVGCAGDTCYRLRDRTTIERSVRGPSGPWVLEHRVGEAQRATYDTACGPEPRGVMRTVVASNDPDRATADFGAGGVLARHADGRWTLRPVLTASNPEIRVAGIGWWFRAAMALALGGAVLAASLGRRSPERWVGAGLILAGGWLYGRVVEGMVVRESTPVFGLVGVALIVAVGVAVTVGGRLESIFHPPPRGPIALWMLPSPPVPPPPTPWSPLPPPPPPPDATRPGSEGPGSYHDGGGRGI